MNILLLLKKWISYIEEEFERRENGFYFKNNGVDTYITGTLHVSPVDQD